MNITTVIRKPIITEQSVNEAKTGKYTFEVAFAADKDSIKRAVEKEYSVSVISVSTVIVKGRKKRAGKKRVEIASTPFKKARVKVKKGQTIAVFEEGAK